MDLIDCGNDLILSDLKRLKKLKSLKEDLKKYFNYHQNQARNGGNLSCQIATNQGFKICKQRVGTSNPKMSPSEGCRLWFVITQDGYYVKCLLYSAKEEKKFPKRKCFDAVYCKLSEFLDR
ncbi:hypothetical protein KKC08_00665 [Patescibacteria group bacterium]|nr:hypothetical protein [Patescibacteria group bacterium]MCG2701830.1 hypothetical protein [Candidatus Parcubacteria bacterium]MBU4265237.1 hypothetical protein [Patescibacteria group bacterium]MBU4390286.1 hypothetical protein [Patescibacteria group bacterium]MBU4396667.1 hypothetical protein [Patescibacteria group bacterium]